MDFLEACSRHAEWRTHRAKAARETAETAAAPQYYVDAYYAYRVILGMRKTGKTPTRGKSRQLWLEISAKVAARVASSPGIALIDAVTDTVAYSKASQFFITPANAVKIAMGYRRRRTHR